MNKRWIAAPFAAIAVAVPYFIAPKAETAYENALAELNHYMDKMGFPVVVERVGYKKGFLGSEAVSRIQLARFLDDSSDPQDCLDIVTEVNHGYGELLQGRWADTTTTIKPLSEQADCSLGMLYQEEQDFADFYQQAFGADGPAIINAHFKFNGATSIDYITDSFHIDHQTEADSVKGHVTEMRGILDLNEARDHVAIAIDWPGFSLLLQSDADNVQVDLTHYSLTGDQQQIYPYLWVGNGKQQVDGLTVQDKGPGGTAFHLGSFMLTSESAIKENKLHYTTNMSLDEATLDHHQLGSLLLELHFSDIDAEALNSLQSTFNDWLLSFQTEDLNAVKPLDQSALAEDIKKIAATSKIEITKLDYHINDHRAHIDGNANLINVDTIPADQMGLSPLSYLGHLQLALNAELDEPWVNSLTTIASQVYAKQAGMDAEVAQSIKDQMIMQFQQIAGQLSAMKYVSYDADKGLYTSQFSLADGKALLNGQVIEIPGLTR